MLATSLCVLSFYIYQGVAWHSRVQAEADARLERALAMMAGDEDGNVYFGHLAGRDAALNSNTVALGAASARTLSESSHSTAVGSHAGENLASAPQSVALGASAARYAVVADHAIFIGASAGYQARSVDFSILVGYAAGRYVENNTYSTIAGYAAGEYADGSHMSQMLGHHAGYQAKNSPQSVIIGPWAGAWAHDSEQSVMIGAGAGGVEKLDADEHKIPSAHHVVRGVYLGQGAGENSSLTTDVVLLGTRTAAKEGSGNSVAIGRGAKITHSNQIVLGDNDVTEIVIGGVTVTKDQLIKLLTLVETDTP